MAFDAYSKEMHLGAIFCWMFRASKSWWNGTHEKRMLTYSSWSDFGIQYLIQIFRYISRGEDHDKDDNDDDNL